MYYSFYLSFVIYFYLLWFYLSLFSFIISIYLVFVGSEWNLGGLRMLSRFLFPLFFGSWCSCLHISIKLMRKYSEHRKKERK